MSIEIEYANSLRLCHISKWEHFDGYGFNLHAEKGKPGQYIGKVDEGSPAEAAGLKEGDRIIEVNGVNISNENHKQVVQRIKACLDETKLLVVDREGENYFKANNIVLKSSLPYVVTIKTPSSPEQTLNRTSAEDGRQSQKSVKNLHSSDSECLSTTQVFVKDNGSENMSEQNHQEKNALNLNMTAKELRAQLAARKKYDPKKDHTIDFKKKYDIVQKL